MRIIGYEHINVALASVAGKPFVHKGMTLTKKQAEKLLCQDLRKFKTAVEQAIQVFFKPLAVRGIRVFLL